MRDLTAALAVGPHAQPAPMALSNRRAQA